MELRDLAAAEGLPLPDILARFRAAGATSIAIPEDTIGGLEEAKRIVVSRPVALGGTGRIALDFPPGPGGVSLRARVAAALRAKTRLVITDGPSPRYAGGVLETPKPLLVNQAYAVVRSLGVGLDPEAAAAVRAAGLGIVGRVGNWEGVRPEGIGWALEQLKRQGVSTVIFSGDAVLGFKGFVADDKERPGGVSTESALRDRGLYYGAVEFVQQKGDALLARAAQDRTVRVHTVSGAEMIAADIPSNIQRFRLAARERNIRLLFVRLFSQERDAVAANIEYVEKIVRALERGGLVMGAAHGYEALRTSSGLRIVMGIGLAAAWALLLHSLTGLAGGVLRTAAFLGGFALIGLTALPGTTGPKLAALAAACLYPTLALVHTNLLRSTADGRASSPGVLPAEDLAPGAALAQALRRLLTASSITLVGAMSVVGLLAERVFLIKADAFAGIKVAQLLPIVVAAAVYALGLWTTKERPWPRPLTDAWSRIVALAGQPILLWQAGVALLALIALGLLVLRSGNDPGVGVSPLELRVRGLLDRLLYARPRFKEFLIGHPAMIVALALAATGRCRWALPLFVVGAIGQVSLLNTFCHLHTPLLVSLWRALLGLAIGVIIGVVAYLLLDRIIGRVSRRKAVVGSS